MTEVFDRLVSELLDGTLDEAGVAELIELVEADAGKRRTLIELYRQARVLDVEFGRESEDFAGRVLAEVARDRRRFVDSVLGVLERRASRRRQVGLAAASIFALLWLGSTVLAWRLREAYQERSALLERKRIEALGVGQTVPGLKARAAELRAEIARLKRLLGYPDATDEEVIRNVVALLDRYYSEAIPRSSKGRVFLCQEGRAGMRLRIDDEWIGVPLMGQPVDPDKLADTQYLLNLANVALVLRRLHDRLALRRRELRVNVGLLQQRLDSIYAGLGEQAALLRAELERTRRRLQSLEQERRTIEGQVGKEVERARAEQRALLRELQAVDHRIAQVAAEGERQRALYRARIAQASAQRGHARLKLGRPRRAGFASRAELLASAIEQDEPDGVVTEAGRGVTLIDLGRADGLRAGLVFLVCTPVPGGFWRYRGRVKVVRVLERGSQVQTLSGSPLARGDQLFSKVFRTRAEVRRHGPVRVAFVGRFPRSASKLARIRTLLGAAGAQIEPRLSHWTTLVVVEEDYENEPDYLKAIVELNIDVLTVDQLREFIAE